MHRGADIVHESGKRQLSGTQSAADGIFRFVHNDAVARFSQRDCGGESVGA